MSNSFLFIVPLSPPVSLTKSRLFLRKLCFNALISQNYTNWKALLIGTPLNNETHHDNFIYLDFEGHKEEKLQMATQYYLDNNLEFNYIIRLDDDDVFNPFLLNTLAETSCDVYVDKYHSFLNMDNGKISQLIKYWFPNTSIIKSSHAFAEVGNFPTGDYKRFKKRIRLIENEHNDFHFYFKPSHKIINSNKMNPVYLRVLNSDSITSKADNSFINYLNQFGIWKKNKLKSFLFLNDILIKKSELVSSNQNLKIKLKFIKENFISLINYDTNVIKKTTI